MADLTNVEILVGTGGIGSGIFFELEGSQTLGRNESRSGRLRDWRDYCKLHIITQYFAMLAVGRPGVSRIRVLPVGKVGNDAAGERLIDEMRMAGMDTSHVAIVQEAPTLFSVCFLYPDSTGGNITSSNSASRLVGVTDIDRVGPEMAAHQGKGIALAAPEVPVPTRERLLDLATRNGFFRVAAFTTEEIAEAKRSYMLNKVDLLAVNIDEAAALAEVDAESDLALIRAGCASEASQFNPDMMLFVTAGPDGSWAYWHGQWEYVPPIRVEVASTAGAGDAYLAGVLAGLVAGMPFLRDPSCNREPLTDRMLTTACDYGTLVAAFSVASPHTIHPDLNADSVGRFAAKHGLRLVVPKKEAYP